MVLSYLVDMHWFMHPAQEIAFNFCGDECTIDRKLPDAGEQPAGRSGPDSSDQDRVNRLAILAVATCADTVWSIGSE